MILLDTHALVWVLLNPRKLSATARARIDQSPTRAVSSASLYELRFKHAIGKWPEIEVFAKDGFPERLTALGFDIRPADGTVMDRAGGLDWAHRDPFDRIIVATSLVAGCPLISKDQAFQTVPDANLDVIW